MPTVKLAGNGFGGVYEGAYGNYQSASDGTFTVDTRDAPSCLARGMAYMVQNNTSYGLTPAAAAASATAFIASTTVTNGVVTVSVTQPDVMRQASLVLTALASPGPSAGSVALTYTANDGTVQTDTFSSIAAGVTPLTYFTSKGVAHIGSNPVTANGVTGGTPFLTLGSTTALSVPVAPGAVDVSFTKETINSGDEAVGTPSTVTLASIVPTTVPNGTHTYSWMYSYLSPIV